MCIIFLPVWIAHKLRCKITTKIAYMQVFKKKRWKALVQLIILLYLCSRKSLGKCVTFNKKSFEKCVTSAKKSLQKGVIWTSVLIWITSSFNNKTQKFLTFSPIFLHI